MKQLYYVTEVPMNEGNTTVLGIADSKEQIKRLIDEFYKKEHKGFNRKTDPVYEIIDEHEINKDGIVWQFNVMYEGEENIINVDGLEINKLCSYAQ